MMSLTVKEQSTKAVIPSDVMARAVGDEMVILHLTKGAYFGLDEVGTRIWRLLNEDQCLQQICDSLLNEYEVAREDFERDLLKLLNDLREQGLVELSEPNS